MKLFKILTALSLTASPVFAATLTFDFEDGTTQGWTNITSPTTGPTGFGIVPTTVGAGGTNFFPIAGSFGLASIPFDDRDDHGDLSLLARSTTFAFENGSTFGISAVLIGGDVGTPIASDSDVTLTQSTTLNGVGFQGIALRRVSDGSYLLTGGNVSNGNGLETVTWDDATISAAISGDSAVETYTIDLVDTAGGGWGWVGMDDITITGVVPEPSSMVLFGLGAIGLLAKRRRSQ